MPVYDTYSKARIITTPLNDSLYGYHFYSKDINAWGTYCNDFKAKTIVGLPQQILQLKIDIPLSFLLQSYEPTILTANGELTVLTGRRHFCEPNNLVLLFLDKHEIYY